MVNHQCSPLFGIVCFFFSPSIGHAIPNYMCVYLWTLDDHAVFYGKVGLRAPKMAGLNSADQLLGGFVP